MNFSVTKNGKELDPSLYTWDESTRTFATRENDLVLDFSALDGVTFDTGDNCAFYTWHSCTFKTGYGCTFDTGYGCVVVRRDLYEIIELEPNKKIKLNDFKVKGFEYIKDTKTITIGNK